MTNECQRGEAMSTNYYEILGCSESSSYSELKESYRRLVRHAHPDKSSDCDANFLDIDRAWKTLRDETSRKEYDASLKQEQCMEQQVIHMEISSSNLTFDDSSKAHQTCRCGETFVINKEDVVDSDCLIECEVCSNCVLIRND